MVQIKGGQPAPPQSKRRLTAKQLRLQQAAARRRRRGRKSPVRRSRSQRGKVGASSSVKRTATPAKTAPYRTLLSGSAKGAPPFEGAVYAIASAGQTLLATTSDGLLTSEDNGKTWVLAHWGTGGSWQYLAGSGPNAVAASGSTLLASSDAGGNWSVIPLPAGLTRIAAIASEPTGELWVGGVGGAFVSSDEGKTWSRPRNLYVSAVSDVFYDEYYNRVYVTTSGTDSMIFTMQLPQKVVLHTTAGWNLRFVRQAHGHLVGSTRFDGMVVQPDASSASVSTVQPVAPMPPTGSGTGATKP